MIDLIGQELSVGDVVIFNKPASGYCLCLGKITHISGKHINVKFVEVEYTDQDKISKTQLCKEHVFKPSICQITEYLLKN